MRRVARQLFTLCSAVSLVLSVAVCVLWVRSRSGDVTPPVAVNGRCVQVYTYHGAAHLYWSWSTPPEGTLLLDQWEKTTVSDPHRTFDGLFGIAPSLCLQLASVESCDDAADPTIGTGFTYVHVPLWMPATVVMLLPLVWVWPRLRARAQWSAGHCTSCGYDLRGSPERCPECGTAGAQA